MCLVHDLADGKLGLGAGMCIPHFVYHILAFLLKLREHGHLWTDPVV